LFEQWCAKQDGGGRTVPIEVESLTADEVGKILHLEEAQTYDLKSRDIAPAKLTKTISAFANADGGELYVGVEESNDSPPVRTWRGFSDQEAANGHIQAFEQAFPLGTYYQYSFLRADNASGVVLKVIVNKTDKVSFASNNIAYLRRGAMSLPQNTPELIKRLEYAKGVSTYESELTMVPVEELTGSEVTALFMAEIVPQSEPSAWLKKQALVRADKPTVAGTLLFSDLPQAHMPKRCGVKVYRYKTKEAVGFRESMAFNPETIEGPLYNQIREAVARTIYHVEQVPRLGEEGLEQISYPFETVHEIVTNAIIHRDYSIADDVHIRIFDNRIEVQSPGRLAGHVTIKNVMKERAHRNGAIVRILNKFPDAPNKDVGEGLDTAFRRMSDVGLKEPVLSENENSFMVTIRHERLASPEEAIMDFLAQHGTIKNSQARSITHTAADYVMKRIFGRMIANGMIEQVPGTSKFTTQYRAVAKS
jgi:ATP-dependent DNA helicase RecG